MKIALAGNPNSGKTTLFNNLTGSSAHVGNWPGVTVDKKEGFYKYNNEKISIIDLPGIYSLSPYSPEEIIARNFILTDVPDEAPDLIINIVDATNLERNLYLTTQLLETGIPMVIALNMMDLIKKNGDIIDVDALSSSIGIPVVGICAFKNKGIKELIEKGIKAVNDKKPARSVLKDSLISSIYSESLDVVKKANVRNEVFVTVKLLENDELVTHQFTELASTIDSIKAKSDFPEYNNDYESIVADLRYKYISSNFSNHQKKNASNKSVSKTEKADKLLTHKIWGIPIFALIMFAVFHVIFSGDFLYLSIYGIDAIEAPGVMLQTFVGELSGKGIEAVAEALADATPWVQSMLVDGLLAGIDAVLSFMPQMLLMFLALSIMEETGYMARIAFILDRAFRKVGLSGKALLPLLMCFGCAVPGIMATKALENEKERKISILIAPFFSCGAKMPIWAVFAATLFLDRGGEFVVFGMYFIGIATAVLLTIILRKTIYKGETPHFIMELPNYHLPQIRSTLRHLWDKFVHYLKRVTLVIAGAVIIIWLLSSFSFKFEMVEDIGDSMIGIISKGLKWLFIPLGFGMGDNGWMFVVAVFTGLIAKEMVVATLGVLGGMSEEDVLEGGELAGTGIAALLATLSVPAAISFMVFNLLSVPCLAAVGAAGAELRSKKNLWGAIGTWLLTAYVVSFVIYWIGTIWWIGLILGIIVAIAITLYILDYKGILKLGKLFNKIFPRKSTSI
ncbi:MAG: ferrous iron transport protein B [Christensenellaceae bacterium]|jgi:ferrous iron transport protein B|nr:ferrous iron transport protein B [Christensenellaceae bacterium]